MWNDEIGSTGAWDAAPCTTVITEQTSTVCECRNFGTYSLIAELAENPKAHKDKTWLTVVRYMGFGLSVICLSITIVVIARNAKLWDQFYLLTMHTSFSYLVGSLAMLAAEFDTIRYDRHVNIAMSACIHCSYLSAGAFLFGTSLAVFIAVAYGMTGGKTWGYVFICYGLPIANVGYTIFFYHTDYGTDPHVFIGWSNATKIPFFAEILACGWAAALLGIIVVANLSNPKTRKDGNVDNLVTQGQGLFGVSLVFALAWTFAYFAHIREPDVERPNFYPISQLLNAWIGPFIFFFMGLPIQKFRKCLVPKCPARKKKQDKYVVQEAPDVDATSVVTSSIEASLSDESSDEDIEEPIDKNEDPNEDDESGDGEDSIDSSKGSSDEESSGNSDSDDDEGSQDGSDDDDDD